MNNHKTRRLGALVLALAMALSLAVTPAWAAGEKLTITGDGVSGGTLTLETGKETTLEAQWDNIPQADADAIEYSWKCELNGATFGSVTFGDAFKQKTTVVAGNITGTVKITVTASWKESSDAANPGKTETAECELIIKDASDPGNVPVTGVTLNKDTLTLTAGQSDDTLVATVNPEGATNKNVSWTSNRTGVATVDRSTGVVRAVSAGTATITATTVDGGYTAQCEVTVNPAAVSGLTFGNTSELVRGLNDPNPWDMTVSLIPAGAALGDEKITWSVTRRDPAYQGDIPTVPENASGLTVKITNGDPGEFTVTATCGSHTASRNVTISGITLTQDSVNMLIGMNRVIAIENMYGYAASGSPSDVVWTSSDPSVVTVMNGELMGLSLGTAVITANKNGYTAECKVTVTEDEDVIAGPFNATTGDPLILSTAYTALNQISLRKSATEYDDDDKPILTSGSPLSYITNLMVPTDQGTLYYNYNSEANTGAGVGVTDRFSLNGGGSIRSLGLLYFVPRQGFTGTAEITFNGWSVSGTSFSGIIKVDVKGVENVSYRTNAGVPVYFLSGDFNSFCRTQTGRDINYVTFNLPQASQGVLYYNYSGTGQTADRVSTSTQYGRSGRYTIDDVCFVPNEAFAGEVRISYRGVDTAGSAFNGEVVIVVSPAGAEGETANVYVSAQRGQPVALPANLFNDACQATIRDTLSSVRLQLPDYSAGTLYYNYRGAGNYDSRVDSATRYYFSGVPGIGSVTFVPASNTTGRVAIPYTGYGIGGTTFTGTLYISMDDTERSTIRYFVPKNGSINFDANSFNNAALLQLGSSIELVEFEPAETKLGTLYYDYRSSTQYSGVGSGTAYYRTPKESWDYSLNLISFRAGASSGTYSIPYTAYTAADANGERDSFNGTVVIQIGAPTPEDITRSCSTSGQVWLSSYDLSSVCRPVMDKGLSYIEITGLPPAEQGRLYLGYTGFKTGTEVKQGDRFYCLGSPCIDQVSFIPHGGYTGRTEITYVGFSSDGQEQVSGRIIVNVTRANISQYFNDMGNHAWAIDAVDFLYKNKTVNGVGGGRFNPNGYISKGDFTLMLVRAFGFTASGTLTYKDVPANSYYYKEICIANLVGIAGSSNGYFYPNAALTRQDAMVMLRNAMLADGRTLTNGLAADLSGYHDQAQIATYAREPIGSLIQMGIVQGDGNGFLRPRALLSRAETAMLMHAIMTL